MNGDGRKALILGDVDYLLRSIKISFNFPDDSPICTDINDIDVLRPAVNDDYSVIAIATESKENLTNCLVETFGNGFRPTPIIIFAQSKPVVIKELLDYKAAFPEFEDCLSNKLILPVRLPLEKSLKESKDEIQLFASDYGVNWEKVGLSIKGKISTRLADAKDADHRHAMGNLKAASRILNGAIRSGDYDLLGDTIVEARAKKLHLAMVQNGRHGNGEEWTGEEKRNRQTSFDELIEKVKGELKTKSTLARQAWHNRFTSILIIDDEKGIWQPVWDFIFGEKATTVDNAEEGLRNVREGKYDCILLDIELNGDKGQTSEENGIEILQRIKNEHYDLPVIMMTAHDDSNMTKKCIRFGADNYFVKEIADSDDRYSIDYYNKFKEIISEIPTVGSWSRRLWDKFREIEPLIAIYETKWPKHSLAPLAISTHLKKAYFLSTVRNDFILSRKLLLSHRRNNFSDAIYNIENALHQLAIGIIADKRKISLQDALEILEAEAEKSSEKISNGGSSYGYLGILDSLSKLCDFTFPKKEEAHKCFVSARHNLGLLYQADFELCFNGIIEMLNKQLPPFVRSSSGGSTLKEFRIEKIPLERLFGFDASQRSHKQISDEGASLLREGFTRSGMGQLPYRVLFIDDEGTASSWSAVLQLIFKDLTISERLDDVEPGMINEHDLVLQDLNLSSQDTRVGCKLGLDTLAQLKKYSFATPVVMLTAMNSSFYVKKAFLRGAVEYFVKSAALSPDDFWKRFHNTIENSVALGKKEKPLWEKLDEVEGCCKKLRLEKSNDIYDLVLSPLKGAFFHYMVLTRQDSFPELFSITRLLVRENPKNDFALLCGAALEGVMRMIWKTIDKNSKMPDTGYLIKRYSDIERSTKMATIWHKRIQSKMRDVNPVNAELFEDTCENIIGLFNDLERGRAGFISPKDTRNRSRSGHSKKGIKLEGGLFNKISDRKVEVKDETGKYGLSKEQLDKLLVVKKNIKE